jgi:hydrogenase expression/formation protein HypD
MEYVDAALDLARDDGIIVTTFGDMMKVPGTESTLARQRADGSDVRVVYSTLDALELARGNPDKELVFLAIGFETTAPTIAAAVHQAHQERIKNFSVLTAHKVMPPAMRALASDPEVGVDGYLCPAHVSAIIGSRAYEFLAEEFEVTCVVAGFEPLDILQGVYLLSSRILRDDHGVENEYSRVVKPAGNRTAQDLLTRFFEPCNAAWRGIGEIPDSGLRLKPEWYSYDARRRFALPETTAKEPPGCICGHILKGIRRPGDCPLFGNECTPERPVGACMVSSEGTCAAWYKYG